MTLDGDLLAEVEAARARLEDLEGAVFEARAEFHQRVRRLHTAGGSMREIATALGMSHQRVHQIVGEDGIIEVEATSTEITLHPSAPASVTAGEDACSFCGAPRQELEKLLAAPGRVFICGGCVTRATIEPLAATCSFCRQPVKDGFAENGTVICRECLGVCRRMLGEETAKRVRRNPLVRCSFCNASQKEVAKLIAGPGVYICGPCVGAALGVAATGVAAPGPRQVGLRPAVREEHACSFCGLRSAQVDPIVKGGRARICNECLDLCQTILEEESR